MKDLTETSTFEKVRRYSLVVAIGSTVLLLLLKVLESWGAFEPNAGYDDYSFSPELTGWGKLETTLSYVLGFSWGIILLVLFVVPRKKSE